jgi:hypothetical protein
MIKHSIVLLIIFATFSFAQQKTNKLNSQNFAKNDFKILSADNNSIVIEFSPEYISEYKFKNGSQISKPGKPNLYSRCFPLFLPTEKNNKIEILESKYKEVSDIDVLPAPAIKKDKYGYSYEYNRDKTIYSADEYYPLGMSNMNETGILRNKYFGSAIINPVQYNPSKKVLRKYTYIKFRVIYGGSPVYLNKSQNKEEYSFLLNSAVNSSNAINWSTKEFNKIKPALINSVLKSGDFYKIEIKEDGIYKIDKSFLQSAGIDVSSINPLTIKIYNNGGSELPYNNSTVVPDSLIENRIYIEGESDGKFDDNDYILFYGSSPNKWIYSNAYTENYYHSIHKYSNSNYYFLTFGGDRGLRIQTINSSNVSNVQPSQYFSEKFYSDPDLNNLGSTGNLWVSQRIGVTESFVINKTLSGYVDGSGIYYRTSLGNASSVIGDNASYTLSDGNSSFTRLLSSISYISNETKINLSTFYGYYSLDAGKNSLQFKMFLSSQYNSSTISGYYDYVEIVYQRSFSSVENNSFHFTSLDSVGFAEYDISTFSTSSVKIFDVTSFSNVGFINPISYSGGIVKFQRQCVSQSPKEYFVIGGSNYLTPASISSRITNQNLHGSTDSYTFVIISPTEFLSAANRLKALRESPGAGNPNYLKTGVFDVNQIYNEFSCGILDPTAIRNFLKYAYNNWTEKPVYVLFLGDGSFDYKNICNLSVKNFLPSIEKNSASSNEIESYVSDDFLTEINENYSEPTCCYPDFASGRICVNSLADANTVIDKIVQYESSDNIGVWKKKIMYVADDGMSAEKNEGSAYVDDSEKISEDDTPKDYEKEKIYIVSYPTVISPQGRRKPGANTDILKGWNEGRLAINYIGHGSTDLWAHEHIFVRDESIPQLTNTKYYPLVFMGSCSLARWDDPFNLSMSEELVNIEKRGAINTIAATRPVYADQNLQLNEYLFRDFTNIKDTLNLPIRIGKVLYYAKNSLSKDDNHAKYVLFGDPTLRISTPQYFTKIDSINGISGTDTAVIKALQKVKICGRVLKPDSTLWSDYNGELTLKIQDVNISIHIYDNLFNFDYKIDGGTIFKGKANIENGKWIIQFVVPKDISYNSGNGKILAYFKNSSTEGSGYTGRFVMNGLDSTAIADTTGPVITMFIDSRSFRSGDLVNQNTKIIADFFDENGINLTGTIGHKIEAIINDKTSEKVDLTSYYNATTGYQYGTLEYPLQNLADGKYSLKIRVWDTYNNLSEATTEFSVKANTVLALDNVYNYPNPMKDNTIFVFQHNFDSPLDVTIKIYTVRGAVIKELKSVGITSKYVNINWDGKDNDGDYIANGTYLYKVQIKTQDGSFSKSTTGKLAKLK